MSGPALPPSNRLRRRSTLSTSTCARMPGVTSWRGSCANCPSRSRRFSSKKDGYWDTYYVGTRYANGHVEGAPFEHYGPLQSEEAVSYAAEILGFVRAQMADEGRG
jgi:hypothetical protein